MCSNLIGYSVYIYICTDRLCTSYRSLLKSSRFASYSKVSPAGALRSVPGSPSSAAAALWDGSHWGDLGRRGQLAKQGGKSWGMGTSGCKNGDFHGM